MDDRKLLKSCPFCGSDAEMSTIPEGHPDAGGMFIQCCGRNCMASSALIYPLMDDVRGLLLERWNRRVSAAEIARAAAVSRLAPDHHNHQGLT